MIPCGKIEEESMCRGVFDQGCKKRDGSLPLISVNTFLPKSHDGEIAAKIELVRSTKEEKGAQITNIRTYSNAPNLRLPQSLRASYRTSPTSGRTYSNSEVQLAAAGQSYTA